MSRATEWHVTIEMRRSLATSNAERAPLDDLRCTTKITTTDTPLAVLGRMARAAAHPEGDDQ